jgi:hypothetical protein
MAKNRKAAQEVILRMVKDLDPSGKNTTVYEDAFKRMNDAQFDNWMQAIEKNQDFVSLIVDNVNNNKVTIENNLKVAKKWGGETLPTAMAHRSEYRNDVSDTAGVSGVASAGTPSDSDAGEQGLHSGRQQTRGRNDGSAYRPPPKALPSPSPNCRCCTAAVSTGLSRSLSSSVVAMKKGCVSWRSLSFPQAGYRWRRSSNWVPATVPPSRSVSS